MLSLNMFRNVLDVFCLLFIFSSSALSAVLPSRGQHNLLEVSYDSCEDPFQQGTRLGEYVATMQNVDAHIIDIIATTEEYIDELNRTINHFECRYIPCNQVRVELQELRLRDFVRISHNYGNQGDIRQIYLAIAELRYVFHILKSRGAEECCFTFSRLFNRLNNHILLEWFRMAATDEQPIAHTDCNITGHFRSHGPMTCDDKRDLIYTVLRHGLHTLQGSIINARMLL